MSERATPSVGRPFLAGAARVQVQSVLFDNDPAAVERACTSIARSAELAVFAAACSAIELRLGDCSPTPCLTEADMDRLQQIAGSSLKVEYEHFGANLGSAGGHNRLAQAAECDFLLILNPDVVVSPRLIEQLVGIFSRPGVGMVEAKQLPIEHPKDYDERTGETSWATTACAMIPYGLFRMLGGFDADSFFLYCDDVDFSWQVRLAGFKVVFHPGAPVFHDKRVSVQGRWQPSAAEKYFSAEAALFMAHKWSRPDLVEKYLAMFRDSQDPLHRKAASAFDARREAGRLCEPVDREHRIGQFVDDKYAVHRFVL